MNTSISHLPAPRQDQLKMITAIIKEVIRPEKIILFGVFAKEARESDIFLNQPYPAASSFYDILIVTQRGERRGDYIVLDHVEGRCHSQFSVSVLAHGIDYVNKRLAEGQYFFEMIRREGILLYDAGNIPFAEAPKLDLAQIRAKAQHDFNRCWFQAKAFLNSARFNQEQQERKVAAFLLHQAAEQAYMAILLAYTGYKPCTHNLEKLRRYTIRFSLALESLFHRTTPEGDQLFKLLLRSYVDARYKENFSISDNELALLIDRISRLLSIAENICKNRFLSLEKMAAAESKP